MKPAITVTWAALLAGSYAVVVPTLVTLLQQSLQAARHIEGYTADILEHVEGIERNTAQAAALKQTRAVAPGLLATAGSLQGHTETIVAALGGRGDGAAPDREVQP